MYQKLQYCAKRSLFILTAFQTCAYKTHHNDGALDHISPVVASFLLLLFIVYIFIVSHYSQI